MKLIFYKKYLKNKYLIREEKIYMQFYNVKYVAKIKKLGWDKFP